MNISVKNPDKKKIADAILNEAKKIKDFNLRYAFLRDISSVFGSVSRIIRERATSSFEKHKSKNGMVSCPHCRLLNGQKRLSDEAMKNDIVDGTYNHIIDLGEYDGYETRQSGQEFYWATCKYCGKKIYSISATFGERLYDKPVASSLW